jgi:hypothetical protein
MTKTQVASNALAVLKADHQKVKDLFERFEKAKDSRGRRAAAEEAIAELKVHSAVEEEVFYPAVREEVDDTSVVTEALEEHHVAKVLIAELGGLHDQSQHETFEAKFIVLAESVRHHIKEEEGTMFAEVKKTSIDLRALGDRILQRKEELKTGGVPKTAEEIMVRGQQEEEESDIGREDDPLS